MIDSSKTKAQLIEELNSLRNKVATSAQMEQSKDDMKRMVKDVDKRRDELEHLRIISKSMRTADRSDKLLEVFTKEVQKLFNFDVTSSILFKGPQTQVTYFSSDSKKPINNEQRKEIKDALLYEENGALNAEISGFETVVIQALKSLDSVHGAVMLASRTWEEVTQENFSMLHAIADMAGTALYRIGLLESLEERVEQRTHELVVLYNLITIISENWKLDDLLELSLVLTLDTVKADRGIIYLLEDLNTPDLKPIIQLGFSEGFQIEVDSLPNDEMARKVIKQHKPLFLDNLAKNPVYKDFNGIQCYAGIPIMARGKIRGVLSLFANEADVFESNVKALLMSIADHLGIGIENSILWEQSRDNIAREERNRMARNLHDSVSQLLYSLTLMAGSTNKWLERDFDQEKIKTSVARIGDTAHQALREMRLLLYELRPAVLGSEGLVKGLERRIEAAEERLGIKVKLHAEDLPKLPNNVEDALYHIALEALNNVVKHSKSKDATITIMHSKTEIVLEVSDGGIGFDIYENYKGQGLRNIRERVKKLGGELIIKSSPEKGTRIRVQLKQPLGYLIPS